MWKVFCQLRSYSEDGSDWKKGRTARPNYSPALDTSLAGRRSIATKQRALGRVLLGKHIAPPLYEQRQSSETNREHNGR